MLSVTVDAVSCYLIPYQPNWASEVSAEFDFKTTRQVGLSNREDRSQLAEAMTTRLSYTALLNAAELATFNGVLNSWDNRPILVPFWPSARSYLEYTAPAVQGALRIWYEPDWQTYSINRGSAPSHGSPSVNCMTAPLVYGRFTDMPSASILSGQAQEVGFSVIETGLASDAMTSFNATLVPGTSVNSLTVPLLNVPFTWGGNERTIDVRIKREKVGFGRTDADAFYAQTARKKVTLGFAAVSDTELKYMLTLFRTCHGSVSPFWIPSPNSLLAADRIYGRSYGDNLSVSWSNPLTSSFSIEFFSLPTEQTIPSGEIFATTIGPEPAKWWGYKVVCGTTTWRFTSYESQVVVTGANAGTFLPQNIQHGTITEEINLAINDCSLTVHAWAGSPFNLLVQQSNIEPMEVTIYEGTIGIAGSAVAIYTGTAQAPETNGQRIVIKLRGLGSILSIKGPRSKLQQTCNAVLGDARCSAAGGGVSSVPSITTTLLAVTSGVAAVNLVAASYPTTWGSADYMRNGYAERPVGGTATYPQRIMITSSYAIVTGPNAGKVGILFATDLKPPLGSAEANWVLKAGCDGYFKTCKIRFNNAINFRGASCLPTVNPTIIPIKQNPATGKKSQ